MNTQVVDDLKSIRALIASPDAWLQRAYARNAAGCSVDPTDEGACRFCIRGAAERICGIEWNERYEAATSVIGDVLHTVTIAKWNDEPERRHSEVLDVLDKAIAKAAA